MYIYMIINKVNNKKYIGLTINPIQKRFYAHKNTALNGGGYYLHSAMRKYGVDNFSIKIIDTAENISVLKEKEKYYIQKYNTFLNGYNLTKGGEFSSNSGFVIALDKNGITIRIPLIEFIERDDLVHINKNKITVFKDGEKKRIYTHEYKTIYFDLGWRSKNFGYTTVKLNNSKVIKIKTEDFDKNIHSGISTGTQTYFNLLTNKFEALPIDKVNLAIHYTKDKVKYYVYDNNNILVDCSLSFGNIQLKNGLKQFSYMKSITSKDQKEWILTEEIINKLKNKYKDFSFIGYRLIKEQL